MVTDLVRDGEDVLAAGDHAGLQYMLGAVLRAVVDARYALQGRWAVKDKHVLADVREHDPEFAKQLESALEETAGLEEGWARVRALAEWVLQPVGGFIIEYETPREAVIHDRHREQ